MRRLTVGAAILAAFGLGFLIRGGGGTDSTGSGQERQASAENVVWTCSMHPQIKLPKAGQCPICFMDLIPLESGTDEDLGPRSLVLSESAAALADIQTAVAEERWIHTEVRLIGKVDYDETLFRTISAWVAGRIDTLFVDFTGTRVAKGERLVSLYSPELYAAQSELLNAVLANRDIQSSGDELMRRTAAATVTSARERMKLWGLTESQIDRIVTSGRARDHLDITSPLGGIVVHKDAVEGMYVQTGTRIYTVADLSRVWVTLNAYESDLVWLKKGQSIDFTVQALPGTRFSGEIVFIDPVLDKKTRTVLVRIDVDNRQGLLKPGMFVNAIAQAGFDPSDTPHESAPLVIPATAPMITGERAIVYVRVPGTEKPTFEGREIVLGPRAGDHYIVESGLTAGEIVVTNGNFKIDSALQIQAKPSMMNPGGGGPVPGHDHGGSKPEAPGTGNQPEGQEAHETVLEVSGEFRQQLGDVLKAYLEVQKALAGDQDRESREAAPHLGHALQEMDMALLDEPAHQVWMAEMPRLRESFAALETAKNMASRRTAFLPVTEALWPTLRRFGYTETQPVRLFHCPMADDGEGADWIQMAATTANPYYGSSMLRCGSQTDSLFTAEPGRGR